MTQKLYLSFVLFSIFFITACTKEQASNEPLVVDIDTIWIVADHNATSHQFISNADYKVTASYLYTPNNYQDDVTSHVIWESDDTSVIFNTANTNIFTGGSKEGSTSIKATYKNIETTPVTVKNYTVTKILPYGENNVTIVPTGSDHDIFLQLTYSDDYSFDANNSLNTVFIWSSSDSSIASVENNGTLSAVSEGNCTITVTLETPSVSADLNITVK